MADPGASSRRPSSAAQDAGGRSLGGERVLLTGAGGQLGSYLWPALNTTGAATFGLGTTPGCRIDIVADVVDEAALRQAFARVRPTIVIHAAAMTDVDGCEVAPERARAINARGTGNIAALARAFGAYLLAVSTDFVFAGDGDHPYDEAAAPRPLSVYGQTKWLGEQAVLGADPAFAVARTAWLYGGTGKHFPRTVLNVLRARQGMEVVADERGNPTFAGDVARAIVRLAARRAPGIFHLVNEGAASRYDLAVAVARAAGYPASAIAPTTRAQFLARYPLPATRPADSRLRNVRAADLGIVLRPWRDALADYLPALLAEFGHSPAAGRRDEAMLVAAEEGRPR